MISNAKLSWNPIILCEYNKTFTAVIKKETHSGLEV